MALNIKDPLAEQLAAEVAELSGESKTQAVRHALEDARDRLSKEHGRSRREVRLDQFLRYEAWPQLPAELRGNAPARPEREEILGYGPEGV